MQLYDLSSETIEKIKKVDYDRFIEKHEWSGGWESVLEFYDPIFREVEGYYVLLPVPGENHPNITFLRVIVSRDEQVLTIFLKDMTYNEDPEMELIDSGYVAICERLPGESFYLATFYHEWFIYDPLV